MYINGIFAARVPPLIPNLKSGIAFPMEIVSIYASPLPIHHGMNAETVMAVYGDSGVAACCAFVVCLNARRFRARWRQNRLQMAVATNEQIKERQRHSSKREYAADCANEADWYSYQRTLNPDPIEGERSRG
jgi:hypothetical protein